MSPKISVIIPVYNTEKYIEECLNSVVHQTLRDIEIIIINDKSPDNAMNIVNQFARKDERIIIIDKQINEGVGKARNDGIKAANGEFVIFMDSDDLYSSNNALKILYDAAIANDVKAAGGKVELLKEDNQICSVDNIEQYGLTFSQSGLMNYSNYQYDYGYTSYIYDREMLLENYVCFPSYSRFQDPPFFVRAMFVAREYFYIDEPVYRYRMVGSESKYTIKKTMDMIRGISDNLQFAREHDLAKLYYLSAMRLNTEGSFMAINNIANDQNFELISILIKANSMVDTEYIKTSGYDMQEPFVLDYFKYVVDTSKKYEKLRNKKILKPFKRIVGR